MRKVFKILCLLLISSSMVGQSNGNKDLLLSDLKSNINNCLTFYYNNLNPLQVDNYFAAIQTSPSNINQVNLEYFGEIKSAELNTLNNNVIVTARNLSEIGVDETYIKSQLGVDDFNISDAARCRLSCGANAVLSSLGCAAIPPPADAICLFAVYGILINCLYDCNSHGPGMPPGGFPANPPVTWAR